MAALKPSAIAPQISIALCTCNGDSYLAEQLDSLLEQTYPPYELVVCDDTSQDESIAILESFATRAPFPVRLYRNPQRLGISANFEQAIGLCTGNVIALCDQDDVWQPNKLALFAKMFAIGMDWVCCDASVSDSDLNSLGYTLWQRVKFDHSERELAREGHFFEVLIKHFVIAGATLAFKAQARDQLLPIPLGWHYDAWLATILAATGKAGLSEIPLQRYRQHSSNALGAIRLSLWHEARAAVALDRRSYYAKEIARWDALAIRLEELEPPGTVRSQVDAKIAHLRRRAALPVNRLARLPVVTAEILNGGYSRYTRNWGSIALDLLVK
jgi:glycosyltransferase involved in cell wall biosynthesis